MPRDESFDTARIYKIVESRKNARATVSGIRTAATEAFAALEKLMLMRDRKSLDAFRAAELNWAQFTTRSRICCADELEKLLRAGQIRWVGTAINGHWNKDYNPGYGYIYALWSTERPRLVKIGATGRHPEDRLAELRRTHGYRHLEHLFFFEIAKPVEAEHEVHKRIGCYLQSDSKHPSREWFAIAPQHALTTVQEVIQHLGLNLYKTKYVSKKIGIWKEIDFWPQGPRIYGGWLASPTK